MSGLKENFLIEVCDIATFSLCHLRHDALGELRS